LEKSNSTLVRVNRKNKRNRELETESGGRKKERERQISIPQIKQSPAAP
jgi:hypothetical protein